MSSPHAPAVSVVMVVLDPHPMYFPEAVQSVLGQTFADFELVVVEDPGVRAAGPYLESLMDPRVRHVRNPARTSLLDQRNQALAEARGGLMAILDADDVCEPDRLAEQVRFLREHPDVDVLGSQIRIINGEGLVCRGRQFPLGHDDLVRALRLYNPLSQSSVMLRTDELRRAGGYQLRHPIGVEDYELWCRLAGQGVRFATHPSPLVRYRLHASQLKATRLAELVHGTLVIKEMYRFGRGDPVARARMWAERLLLWLPRPVALALLTRACYGRSLSRAGSPAAAAAEVR